MAKKIRFPLEMDNGIEVRSIEELRDNFCLARVLAYYKNGKLVIWLRDRYANDLADAIEAVNPSEQDLAKKLSEIFDIPYNEKIETELKKIAEREERLKRLKQFTQEQSFIDHIDSVAFDQDELYDLLDEDTEKIYLCGDRFSIPLSKHGVSYVGINNPIAVIDSKVEIDWHEKKISVEGVTFDEKYQNIIEKSKVKIGEYWNKSYLYSLILSDEKKDVLRLYDLTKAKLEKMEYDSDIDVQNKQKFLKDIEEKSTELVTTRKKKGFYYSSYWLFSSNMCASMKDSVPCGRALQLVYDYNKCNSYAKEIMDRAELVIVSPIVILGDLLRTDKYFDQYKDIEKTKEIAKNFINYLKMPTNLKEGYRFILLALMILRVDMTDMEKKLSLICEFAKLLSITDKEFEDIINIMKMIYENKKASYSFLSKRTSEVFGVVSDLYKTPTLKYGGIVRDSGFSQLFGIKRL